MISRIAFFPLLFTSLLQSQLAAISPEDIAALQLRSPLPTATTLNGAAAAGNNIVAVGLDGVAVTSSDGGITWSLMETIGVGTRKQEMYACASDGSTVVAAGQTLTATSDFRSWEFGDYSGGFRFDVAYGNGNFVATGRVSNVVISDDGLSWNEVELPAGTENLEAIAFGNGVFAAGGANGRLLRSVNGTSWEIGRAGSQDEGWFRSMRFANGRFLALGDNGMFYSSENGLNWTSHSADNTQEVGAYFNGRYIGFFGSTGTDFTDIQERGSGLPGSATEMLIVGNRLVAVGRDGMLATSEDGLAWASQREVLGESFSSVAFDAGNFVIADDNAGRLYSSSNGRFWTQRFESSNFFRTNLASSGGGQFCLLTQARTCVRSSDGINWEETGEVMPFISDTTGLHYLNNRFVTVGNSGGVASSVDGGVTWTTHETGLEDRLTDIAYLNGTYVATGFTTDVYTSPDLNSWTTRATGFGGSQIISTNDQFVVSRPAGTSPDGINWTPFSPPTWVRFGFGRIGFDPELGIYNLASSLLYANAPGNELTDWESFNFPATGQLNSMASGNGVLVAVGGNGLLLTTPVEAGGYEAWVTVNLASLPVIFQGPSADPDVDGITNLEEYARGTDPNSHTAPLPVAVRRTSFGPEASWQQQEGTDDLQTTLEYSKDLESWSSEGVSISRAGTSITGRVTGEAGSGEELYMRVSWSL